MSVTRCILICQSAESNENSNSIKAQIEKVLSRLPVEETEHFKLCWMPQFLWKSLEQAKSTSWSSELALRETDEEYLYIHDALDSLSSLLDLMDEIVLEVIWISDGHQTFKETNVSTVHTYGALMRARKDYRARIHVVDASGSGHAVTELTTWAEDLGTGELFKMEDLRTLVDPMIIWRGPMHFSRLCPAHLAATRRDPHFLNNHNPRSSPSNIRKPASSSGFSHQFPSSGLPTTSSSRTLPSSDRGSYQTPDEVWLADFFLSRHPISIGNDIQHPLWFNTFCFAKIIGSYDLRDIKRHLLHPDLVYKLGCIREPGARTLQYLISSQSEEQSPCWLIELRQTSRKKPSINPPTKTYAEWLAAVEIAKTVKPIVKLDEYPDWEACVGSKSGPKLLIYANGSDVFGQQMLRREEMELLGRIWLNSKPTIHPDLVVAEEDEEKEARKAAAAALPRRSRRKGTLNKSRDRINLSRKLPKQVWLSDLLGELPVVSFDALIANEMGTSDKIAGEPPKKSSSELIKSCIIPTPEEERIKIKAIVEETLNLGVAGMEKEKLREILETRKRSFSRMMRFYEAEPLLGARSSSAPTARQQHEESIRLTLKLKRKRRRKLAVAKGLKKKKNGKQKPMLRGQSLFTGYKPNRLQPRAPIPRGAQKRTSKPNATSRVKENRGSRWAYKQNCNKVFSLVTKELRKRHSRSEPGWRKRRDFCYKQIKSLIEQRKPEFRKMQLKEETLEEYLALLLDRVLPAYDLEF